MVACSKWVFSLFGIGTNSQKTSHRVSTGGNYVLRRGHFHPKGFLSVNWLVQSRLILSTRNPFYLHCWRWSQKSFVTLSKFLVCHRTLPTDFLAQIQIGSHTRVYRRPSVFPCDVVIDALQCMSFKEQYRPEKANLQFSLYQSSEILKSFTFKCGIYSKIKI